MSEDSGKLAPARPQPSAGQSSVVRGPGDTDTLSQQTLSPVTSSKSLSPLNKRTGGRHRVPGFPQRVTQASASVNNVSESAERRREPRGPRHKTVDTESGTGVQPVQSPTSPANNLSLGLLGRLLFTQSERVDLWSNSSHVYFLFPCN